MNHLIETKSIFFGVLMLFQINVINAQNQLAFPTAEGYGKYATGGRGGKVYEITTLNGNGAGSIGEAIAASGPRTVVFRVAGTIEGAYKIGNPNITIAGQTAPGDGICIKGTITVSTNDVIIRYIRVRHNGGGDAINGSGNNIILDHVSASWSGDEVLSIYRGGNLTLQYCIISEACSESHRFGGLWGTSNSTCHHNLLAHNDSRNPRWKTGKNDYRNNVIYNWGYNSCYGSASQINMIANYYKPGPATKADVKNRIAEPYGGNWYVAENIMVGDEEVTNDNWKGMAGSRAKRLESPWDAMPINQETAESAYKKVLAHAGCSFPSRDAVDTRIMEEVRTGTAKYGNGIISKPGDVGGWPELKSAQAPADGDHDGMSDSWEEKNGLNPNDPTDGNALGKDGYTNLEIYMNSLVDLKSTTATITEKNREANSLLYILNDRKTVHFSIKENSRVKLELYSVSGVKIITLFSGIKKAGTYSIPYGDLILPVGPVICRLNTENKTSIKKMLLFN